MNNHSLAIEMALNGLGVVMGRKTLIQPLLDAGRLVALSENEAPSPFGYDLICPQEEPFPPDFPRLQRVAGGGMRLIEYCKGARARA